jgi:uncharacterized protein
MKYLKQELIKEAKKYICNKDPSHDFNHALRVLKNAEYISSIEGGNLDIIIPATLFHDVINYKKNDIRSKNAALESAEFTESILNNFSFYNYNKIYLVKQAIIEHSYSNGIKPKTIESKIVQDADRLEATGAISIMRTFSSGGQMSRMFYDINDPFCNNREPNCIKYSVDLFYSRLLKVKELMNTNTAKKLAENRTKHLYNFLEQLKQEIQC